jgi:hypothetical protein
MICRAQTRKRALSDRQSTNPSPPSWRWVEFARKGLTPRPGISVSRYLQNSFTAWHQHLLQFKHPSVNHGMAQPKGEVSDAAGPCVSLQSSGTDSPFAQLRFQDSKDLARPTNQLASSMAAVAQTAARAAPPQDVRTGCRKLAIHHSNDCWLCVRLRKVPPALNLTYYIHRRGFRLSKVCNRTHSPQQCPGAPIPSSKGRHWQQACIQVPYQNPEHVTGLDKLGSPVFLRCASPLHPHHLVLVGASCHCILAAARHSCCRICILAAAPESEPRHPNRTVPILPARHVARSPVSSRMS